MTSNVQSVTIECASSHNSIFTSSRIGDVLIYPSLSNQKICIGNTIGEFPCLTLSNNYIGVCTSQPQSPLHVQGNTTIDGTINVQKNSMVHGAIATNPENFGAYFNTIADERRITIEGTATPSNALHIVNSIPVYHLKHINDVTNTSVGCMATDLHALYPNCVTGIGDQSQYSMVDYSKLVPLLIQSIKQLKSEIDALQV